MISQNRELEAIEAVLEMRRCSKTVTSIKYAPHIIYVVEQLFRNHRGYPITSDSRCEGAIEHIAH